MSGAIRDVRVEIRRCERSIESGGAPAFWIQRLEEWAKKLETAAAMLRAQADVLKERSR